MDAPIVLNPLGQRFRLGADSTGHFVMIPVPPEPIFMADETGAIWQLCIRSDGTTFTQKTTVVIQP